jgi:hypothetical protein
MSSNSKLIFITIAGISTLLSGCTGQLPGSFRFLQQTQNFNSQQDVNTKIDLLWVIDNSSSMDVSQQKIRNGFSAFASKYLLPTWDIRTAVISTDLYLANPAFSGYLSKQVTGSVGYKSPYINTRLASFQNPSWNTSLINLTTGVFDSGFNFNALNPLWGSNYARLLPGIHDGPLTSFCFEAMPYFMKGVTQCSIRDDQTLYSGTTKCLHPDTGAGESSLSQCVNTIENNTVHSGKAIITTMPPTGTLGDSAWINQLVDNFMINASTGSSGSGSERGLSSVLQLISDNENTNTAFFRAGSLRGIIFVSDEDDQSMVLPTTPPASFNPFTSYGCDQAGLLSLNGGDATISSSICCASGCTYGDTATTCTSSTVDGLTFTLGICVDQSKLLPVANVKQSLDTFFQTLDGTTSNPNYFIATITATTAAGLQSLQTARYASATSVGTFKYTEVNRSDRYIALGNLVSGNSLVMDISVSDYSPILDAIGQQIITKKSTFTLSRVPTSGEDMQITIVHANGTTTIVASTAYVINGNQVTFTDPNFVLSLSATDKISINYQPKTGA